MIIGQNGFFFSSENSVTHAAPVECADNSGSDISIVYIYFIYIMKFSSWTIGVVVTKDDDDCGYDVDDDDWEMKSERGTQIVAQYGSMAKKYIHILQFIYVHRH